MVSSTRIVHHSKSMCPGRSAANSPYRSPVSICVITNALNRAGTCSGREANS